LSILKDDILLCQPHYIPTDAAPSHLPPSIHTFVSEAVGILYDHVPKLWSCLKGDVWALSGTKLSPAEQELFRVYGWRQGLSK
jgi:hypothetical protein